MSSGHPAGPALITEAKHRLRREMKARRAALPGDWAMQASRRAVRHLWSLPPMARARNLAIYLPVGSELDCSLVADEAWARGRNVLLPVIDGKSLVFARFTPESELRRNRYGIPEPAAARGTLVRARHLDVIIAPLLAFDASGRRLGMGGGYYDRTLSFLNARSCPRRPRFIGIAFEMQKRSTVPGSEQDVYLDYVATDQTTYRFT